MGGRPISISVGERFGRLVVESIGAMRNRQRTVNCVCDCGNRKAVQVSNLRKNTTSCGCFAKEVLSARSRTHGMTNTPTYASWRAMIRRCTELTNIDYKDYGGRGITVCDRWLHSFANFLADMGERRPGTTIDRIDNNGDYIPGNARWATSIEQGRNKRIVKLTPEAARVIRVIRAEGRSLASIASQFGVSVGTVADVVNGRTWTP